jgi:hypothetical protein
MGQGNAMTHARGPEALAFQKRLDGGGMRDAVSGLDERAQLVHQAFLAGDA